jgi:hypothetical protein
MGKNKSASRVNKRMVDEIIALAMSGEMPEGLYFAKVTAKLGEGRMKIYYEESKKGQEGIGKIRGALQSKGRCPIQTNDVVIISAREFERGDSSKKHFDISGVLQSKEAYQLKKKNIIPDYFLTTAETGTFVKSKEEDTGIEFDYDEEIDEEIDNI